MQPLVAGVYGGSTCRLARALFVAVVLLRSQETLADITSNLASAGEQHVGSPHKIGIIGAGIGGAFTAHNLRQLLNDTVELQV